MLFSVVYICLYNSLYICGLSDTVSTLYSEKHQINSDKVTLFMFHLLKLHHFLNQRAVFHEAGSRPPAAALWISTASMWLVAAAIFSGAGLLLTEG